MRVSDAVAPGPAPLIEFCRRHYRRLAVVVLALAAFNLTFRLDREVVTEWDEALYATSAAETAVHGGWIGTTLEGQLDYYNTKPPLNVWLIALSFKALGPSLVSLRLPSVLAAWFTVFVLVIWGRRAFGPAVALVAGVVLSTTFGFLYVHSGRSANTDALFTLLMLLVVVALWSARDRGWPLVWLGPAVAAIFLLRGMAVLMPLTLIGIVLALDWRRLRERWAPLCVAFVLMAAPIGAWAAARWQIDRMRFIEQMVQYDFVARSVRALEGHRGSPLYYLDTLQRDQYDWLLAGAAALVLFPLSWRRVRAMLFELPGGRYLPVVAGAWFGVTLVIPTLMQTKVAWYLNPFFPIFALLVAAAIAHGFAQANGRRRQQIFAGLVVLAFIVAEAKLIYYSYTRRDVRYYAQGLVLGARDDLAGRRVFRPHWPRSCRFVLERVVGAVGHEVHNEHEFLTKARPGDYLLISKRHVPDSRIPCVASESHFVLCKYPE